MALYSFKDDYSEGAHPSILQALLQTNLEQQVGYGLDDYSQKAANILREKLENPNANVHFVAGGTQANQIVISSVLKPFESVISADTAHINVHETGAIEFTGHKINTVTGRDGKLRPQDICKVVEQHIDEHMVKPKLVFISNSTEIGTIYKKRELEDLRKVCDTHYLYLYLDGARLGPALCSKESDLTLADLSRLLDVFYIGGTKNGALMGEAIIINNNALKTDFRFHLKQKGALLAKGRLLGLQFAELLKDNLYFDLAQHANSMASKLSSSIEDLGYSFLSKSVTNQVFPIFSNEVINRLCEKYLFHIWSKVDDKMSAIRLVTSWATKEEAVDCFINDLKMC